MDQIKFDLINPTAPLRRASEGEQPPSPRVFRFSMLPSLYVAASMPSYVQTRIVDEDLEPINYDTDADLIGISFMTYNAPRAYEIAQKFRREKGKPVIFGGYHPTLLPEEAGRHADAVCVGDAEPTVPTMIEDFKNGRLKPIYTSRPASLENLPIPKRELIEAKDYAPLSVIQATRGCHFRCTFCSVAAFHQYKFRTRPIDEVLAELETLGNYVLFMDDSLTADREYAKELFSKMIPLGKTWFSQCSISIAQDPELLELARQSGCRGLFVGFESLSSKNLQTWKKHKNIGQDYLEIVNNLHAAGIAVYAGFVFGTDDDTPDVFQNTLEFLLESNVEVLQATTMTPFPGTPLHDEMSAGGRILDKDWSLYDFGHVVYEPKHMSRETLYNGVAWVKNQFYSRNRIFRRAWRSRQYMGSSLVLKAVLPLNLGYRQKMAGEDVSRCAQAYAQGLTG
jgi:radical SAM superfamily enzyme YgiQ (UPF0313 family)